MNHQIKHYLALGKKYLSMLPSSHRRATTYIVVLVVTLVIPLLVFASAGAPAYHYIETKTGITLPMFPDFGFMTKQSTAQYGIAAGSSLGALSSQELDARMAATKSLGASWIRFDIEWSNVQADGPTTYNWQTSDRLVEAANKYGLKVLGVIDYTPRWARSNDCPDSDKCHPADPGQFANFAKATVQRYESKNVHAWELWNEPNNPGFWQPKADPVAYTALLKAAYPAIHSLDASAVVVSGGLSPQATNELSLTPIDFLRGMYGAGAQRYFDAAANHPYTFPLSPADTTSDSAWRQMVRDTGGLRSIMVSAGDTSKKIWITEYGSPTDGPGAIATIENPNLAAKPYVVNEALQAKLLTDAVAEYKKYEWLGPFMYYSYKDAGTDPSTNENFFGLVSADNRRKPAYYVFQKAAQE